MRDIDGLLPQEAFDELLKYLFYKDCMEKKSINFINNRPDLVRQRFSEQLRNHAPWALDFWPENRIRISDLTLSNIQDLFSNFKLTEIPLDVRSAALQTFLGPELRKGLGIFLTPEDIVRMMVEVIQPEASDIVLDPACGSGTFLIETIRFISDRQPDKFPLTVYGVDKNPRMLLLADLNLGHDPSIAFERICGDSLRDLTQQNDLPLGLKTGLVDIIFTNPPFGVTVTRDTGILDLFHPEKHLPLNEKKNGIPSEVMFVQLCLRLLRPGGKLGIILPRSVITNERIAEHRHIIDQVGHLTEIIELPPETFASMGTQTTTVAAFFKRHSIPHKSRSVSVRVCHVTNVGFDATGRRREGNQLSKLATRLEKNELSDSPQIMTYPDLPSEGTLQRAADILFRRDGYLQGTPLGKFIEIANTGRTPSRSAYTDDGVFIIKVGNLTGRGIDWEPRDRNFVTEKEGFRRQINSKLTIQYNDILLTSSAHTAHYIAKKVDVIVNIPPNYGDVTFVGEIIRIRPAKDIDPFILLAALRHPFVRENLQASVRGQTAHLNPSDLLNVRIPWDLRYPNPELLDVSRILHKEANLAFELNLVALDARRKLKSTRTASI